MYHKIKLATLGLGLLLSVFAMGSCGTDPDTVLLEQALATPTLAIKSNGQSLEAYEGEPKRSTGFVPLRKPRSMTKNRRRAHDSDRWK
jgi:hypothetical protein